MEMNLVILFENGVHTYKVQCIYPVNKSNHLHKIFLCRFLSFLCANPVWYNLLHWHFSHNNNLYLHRVTFLLTILNYFFFLDILFTCIIFEIYLIIIIFLEIVFIIVIYLIVSPNFCSYILYLPSSYTWECSVSVSWGDTKGMLVDLIFCLLDWRILLLFTDDFSWEFSSSTFIFLSSFPLFRWNMNLTSTIFEIIVWTSNTWQIRSRIFFCIC